MQDRDTKGDVYEYMLSKIATSGQNGQFRTPRHIIELMVEMMAPQPADVICDPASGTCGFLVCAGEYIRREHPSALTRPGPSKHFHNGMFSGYDFDNTMLRIGSMNMQLHGVQNPKISYRDSLAEDYASDVETYSLILANPPFAGSLDYENTAKGLLQVARTKKTELLFLSLFLRLLKPGGRAAVIVPDGVLFGSSKAHKELRRILVEEQKLDGIVSLPAGVFKPYSGVSTAILLFTKTNSGGHRSGVVLRPTSRRLQPRRQADTAARRIQSRRSCWRITDRGRARKEQPPRCARPLARARWFGDGAASHRAIVLRPEGRHRGQRLRPQYQPLQGDRLRRA